MNLCLYSLACPENVGELNTGMADTLKGKAEKAQKATEKASAKFESEVTTSLEQLEHPGVKSQKAPEKEKAGVHKAAKPAAHGKK